MTYLPPDTPAGTGIPPSQIDVQPPWADRWVSNMVLAIQAVQRLHAAFDAMFVRSKSNP